MSEQRNAGYVEAAAAPAADRVELIVREQRQVAAVGLERRVENVARERDRSDRRSRERIGGWGSLFGDESSGGRIRERNRDRGYGPDDRSNDIPTDVQSSHVRIFNKQGEFIAVATVENGLALPRVVLTSLTSG